MYGCFPCSYLLAPAEPFLYFTWYLRSPLFAVNSWLQSKVLQVTTFDVMRPCIQHALGPYSVSMQFWSRHPHRVLYMFLLCGLGELNELHAAGHKESLCFLYSFLPVTRSRDEVSLLLDVKGMLPVVMNQLFAKGL